jgi:hypothetical protein
MEEAKARLAITSGRANLITYLHVAIINVKLATHKLALRCTEPTLIDTAPH